MSADGGVSPELVGALAAVTGYDASARSAASSFLEHSQTQPGFHYQLVSIIAERNGGWDDTVRTQAATLFKNSTQKYWRKSSKNSIQPAEKASIRPKLLALFDEPDRAIAKLLAVSIGHIARQDYPTEWPELFETLAGTIQDAANNLHSDRSARLRLHRALLAFHQAVKNLSSNRMLRGKQIMQKLCEQSFPFLTSLYRSLLESWTIAFSSSSPLSASPPSQPEDIELSLLTFKLITKLVVYGWGGTTSDPEASAQFTETQIAFFRSSRRDLQHVYALRKSKLLQQNSAPLPESIVVLLNRHLITYGKFHKALLLANHHIFHGFGETRNLVQNVNYRFIQEACENVTVYVTDEPNALFPLKFVVQSLFFMKMCFTQFPTVDASFRDDDLAISLTGTIINHLLPLRPPDLAAWEADPEEFVHNEGIANFHIDLRPCAEKFLMDLVAQYPEVLVPKIRQLLDEVQTPRSFEEVLRKEAVYTAFGTVPGQLSKAIVWKDWLQGSLVHEAMGTDPSHVILRRRVAWLIGLWFVEDTSAEVQTVMHQTLCHLMASNPSTDLAVRLTAAQSFAVADAWDLDLDAFMPFVQATMNEIANLLSEVQMAETQMRLNDVLGSVISKAGRNIAPYLEQLMAILPALWTSAESENLFRSAVLATMKKLVDALERDSQAIQGPICQLVQFACNPSQDAHVFLQEDGIELWKATLRWAEAPSQPLMDLAPLAVALLPDSTEVQLLQVLNLVESYLLLAPEEFMQKHTLSTLINLSTLIRNMQDVQDPKSTKPILYTIDLLVQVAPLPWWEAALNDSGTFAAILAVLGTENTAVVVTRYLTTLARIAIIDATAFLGLLNKASATLEVAAEASLSGLIANWLDRYDNLSYPGQRKLVALALSYMVQTNHPLVLDRLDEIITVWLSALGETEEGPSGESVPMPSAPSSSPVSWGTRSLSADDHIFDEDEQLDTPRVSTPATTPAGSPIEYLHQSFGDCLDEEQHTEQPVAGSSTIDMSDDTISTLTQAPVELDDDGWPFLTVAETAQHGSDTPGQGDGDGGPLITVSQADDPPPSPANSEWLSADIYYNMGEQNEESLAVVWGEDSTSASPETLRHHAIRARSPLHTSKLTTVIGTAMEHAQAANGGPEAFSARYLHEVPPAVMQEFLERLHGIARGGD